MNTLTSYNQAVFKYDSPSVKPANSVSIYYERTLRESANPKRFNKNAIICILSLLVLIAVLTLIHRLPVPACNETPLARKSETTGKEIQILERKLAKAMENSSALAGELDDLKEALKGIHLVTNLALANHTEA